MNAAVVDTNVLIAFLERGSRVADALVLNVPLCTFDQHFRNVPLLEVVEVDNA